LIGDLGFPGTGDDALDWLPHRAVALFTENDGLSGDRSSFFASSGLGKTTSFTARASGLGVNVGIILG
jgi:hypothetical protein